jgi:hypothetical protein
MLFSLSIKFHTVFQNYEDAYWAVTNNPPFTNNTNISNLDQTMKPGMKIIGVLDFVHHPGVKSRTRHFGNYLFLSSGEGRKMPTLLGPLERANLNHWTISVI